MSYVEYLPFELFPSIGLLWIALNKTVSGIQKGGILFLDASNNNTKSFSLKYPPIKAKYEPVHWKRSLDE